VLHLVVTKRDELLKEAHAIESLEAAKRLEDEFRARFTGSVGWVSCWQLAARPLDGTMPTEEVVAALFAAWVSSTRRYEPVQLPVLSLQAGARDFCRFKAQ
jgi:hypothetical protein